MHLRWHVYELSSHLEEEGNWWCDSCQVAEHCLWPLFLMRHQKIFQPYLRQQNWEILAQRMIFFLTLVFVFQPNKTLTTALPQGCGSVYLCFTETNIANLCCRVCVVTVATPRYLKALIADFYGIRCKAWLGCVRTKWFSPRSHIESDANQKLLSDFVTLLDETFQNTFHPVLSHDPLWDLYISEVGVEYTTQQSSGSPCTSC